LKAADARMAAALRAVKIPARLDPLADERLLILIKARSTDWVFNYVLRLERRISATAAEKAVS
jgi:hypothetical protein